MDIKSIIKAPNLTLANIIRNHDKSENPFPKGPPSLRPYHVINIFHNTLLKNQILAMHRPYIYDSHRIYKLEMLSIATRYSCCNIPIVHISVFQF